MAQVVVGVWVQRWENNMAGLSELFSGTELSGLMKGGTIDGISGAMSGGQGASQGNTDVRGQSQGGGFTPEMYGEYLASDVGRQNTNQMRQQRHEAGQIQPLLGYQDMSMPGNNTAGLTGLKGLLALMQQARR